MIQYTPENTIILYVFQTLLAGLVFLASAWRNVQQFSDRNRFFLTAGFFFFAGFALLRSFHAIVLSQGWAVPGNSWSFLVICALESISLLLLIIWLAPSKPWKGILAVASAALLLAHCAGSRLIYSEVAPTFEPVPQTAPLHFLLTLVLLFLAAKRSRDFRFIQLGLVCLAGSYLAEAFFVSILPQPAVGLWNLQHLGRIIGLLCFALHLEKEGSHIFVQFFIRLNMVFIISANIFMLLLSENERKQYLDFSATQVQDLAEFLRGHVIYFQARGLKPAAIVGREEINHKIVSELGRITALKQIKMEVLDQQLLMSINPDGVIAYRTGAHLFSGRSDSIYDYGEKTVLVLKIPILFRGRSIGFVQFDEDLLVISRTIGSQMQLIFSSFTIVVFVTLGALGFIVARAQKTIRQQYSALQEKQEELIQASRLASIGELIDGVAHEVNNPTGVILIRSECALASLPAGQFSNVREDLQEIRLQASRMTKLVRNLLAFSRSAPMQAAPVDLNQVVRRGLELVSPCLRITGIQVQMGLEPTLPAVRGDADRLEQVVVNLVKNAADAMPEGGALVCTTRKDHEFVTLSVSDTGVGIPPGVLGEIFNPFFTTKAPGDGTGLGLSISSSIVRDHGGRMEVESEPGRGTVFTVFLPSPGR